MGGREEQPQPLVGEVHAGEFLAEAAGVIVMVARSHLLLDPQSGEVAGTHLIGADAIDRAILRRGHQPGLGTIGHTSTGPHLDCADHGIVEGLLGEVEVVEPVDQCREQPPVVLRADRAEDPGGRLGVGVHQ